MTSQKYDAALMRIVGPIVRGQIRSFMISHPGVLRADLAPSLAKRIINDLACGSNAARLKAATLDTTETPPIAGVATSGANPADCAGNALDGASCPGRSPSKPFSTGKAG